MTAELIVERIARVEEKLDLMYDLLREHTKQGYKSNGVVINWLILFLQSLIMFIFVYIKK